MKLTKTKLKQIIKEELGKVLGESADVDLVALLGGEDEYSITTTAEHHGREDYRTGDEKWADAWEAFEGGKYLEDYYLGYDNAAEEEEMDLYYSEEEETE